MEQKQKEPWLAALLNLFLPGSGYIYLGKWVFGWLLLLSIFVGALTRVIVKRSIGYVEAEMTIYALIAAIITLIAFSYDAYVIAKQKQHITSTNKSPWVSGILNFFMVGLGYLYIRKRDTFGFFILMGWLITIFDAVSLNHGIPPALLLVDIISLMIYCFAFGYDAYQETKGSSG